MSKIEPIDSKLNNDCLRYVDWGLQGDRENFLE